MHVRVFTSAVSAAVLSAATLLAPGCSGGDPKGFDAGPGDGLYIFIEGIEPSRGPLAGGNTVVVSGSGFASPGAELNNFLIGDVLALDVDVVSDREARVVMPPSAEVETVDLVVFNGNGSFALGDAYSYNPLPTITQVDPVSGPSEGGQTVTITGTGFADLEPGENTVFFAGAEAEIVEVTSDSVIVVESPPGVPPKANTVRIDNANGEAALPASYSYLSDNGVLIYRHRGAPGLTAAEVMHLDLDTNVIETAFAGPPEGVDGVSVATVDGATVVYKDTSQRLFRLNKSGERTELGLLAGCNQLHALAFHQETLFAICRSNPDADFGTVDLETMTFTPVGVNDFCCRMNLASNGSNLFFMRDNTLGIINPETGAVSQEVVTPLNRVRGLQFHDGRLFAVNRVFAGGGGSQSPGYLYEIDPATGASTLLMDLGPSIHGISAVP